MYLQQVMAKLGIKYYDPLADNYRDLLKANHNHPEANYTRDYLQSLSELSREV